MKAPACCLVAASLVLPSLLVAQTRQANGPLASTPQELLRVLSGTWHFEVYSQASTSPLASGQREQNLLGPRRLPADLTPEPAFLAITRRRVRTMCWPRSITSRVRWF